MRPEGIEYNGVFDDWDKLGSVDEYAQFTMDWLTPLKRVLKPTGTIWVSGTYHNIHTVGYCMLKLGYFILNDVTWIKTNPTPNFSGRRFCASIEELIWAQSKAKAKYTFNYKIMKELNGGLQMRADWKMPTCGGKERLRDENGQKLHPTQKPELLLRNIVMACSNAGDVVLDPFFGTGTTGVVAQRMDRHWIGIERDRKYTDIAIGRLLDV